MIKTENYPNAYREVYEILKFVPVEDFNKIPKKFIDMIEKNMNKEYEFFVDGNIDFLEEQELMKETKNLLAYIYLNYWGTEEEKEIINTKFKKDIEDEENQKIEFDDEKIFGTKEKTEENSMQKSEMVVYKEKSFITKIFEKIKSFFK